MNATCLPKVVFCVPTVESPCDIVVSLSCTAKYVSKGLQQKSITGDGKDFNKETLRQKWHGPEQRAHNPVEGFSPANDQ